MGQYRNIVLFVLLGAIWGGAYPVIKVGVAANPPVSFAAVRYDIAGAIMVVAVALTADYWYPRSRADWLSVGLGATLIIAAYNALLFVGEQLIPSAIAGILVGLMPLFSAGFSKLLLAGERLDALDALGVLLGFAGIVAISAPDAKSLLASNVVGQLLVVGAAVSMALGSVLTERLDTTQPAMTMEAWSMALGAVALHGVVTVRSGTPYVPIEWTRTTMLGMLYLAVLSSALAYFLYFDLLDRLGPVEMNFIAYAGAAFGVVFGFFLLGERVDVAGLSGFVAILSGFMLLKRTEIASRFGTTAVSEERAERND
ncbi:EamA family transporter [Halobacteriales archaeon QS_6_64_34]|nr:MAG: EamA family transporter [Halobacteriales archaeon QS_6_64_34]